MLSSSSPDFYSASGTRRGLNRTPNPHVFEEGRATQVMPSFAPSDISPCGNGWCAGRETKAKYVPRVALYRRSGRASTHHTMADGSSVWLRGFLSYLARASFFFTQIFGRGETQKTSCLKGLRPSISHFIEACMKHEALWVFDQLPQPSASRCYRR